MFYITSKEVIFFIQDKIITLTRWVGITVIVIKYIKKSEEINFFKYDRTFIIFKTIIQTTILKDFHLDDFICESMINEKM